MRGKIGLIAAGAVAFGLPSLARAYLLPAEAILESIATRRARLGFETLVADGRRQTPGEAPEPVRWLARANDAYRIETEGPSSQATLTTVGGRRFEFDGFGSRPPERAPHDLVAAFLISTERDPDGTRGLDFLRSHLIDSTVVSLARLGRRVAYVIGAKPWEPDRPQLWVDKDLAVPIRLIARDRTRGMMRDIRLLEYESPIAGGFFPARIERYENGALVETTVIRRLELNVPVDASLFRTPR